jgi:hypothetical protein
MKRLTTLLMVLLAASAALTTAHAQGSGETDYMSANIIVHEMQAMGYDASIDQDDSGDPRVTTAVDGHKWQIYFYDCGNGPLAERRCKSFQFFADNLMPKPVPSQTINRWNKEYRYAKAYLQQNDNPGCPKANLSCAARIEVDVLMDGTNAEPAQTYRAYFAIMQRRADGFRQFIGAR